MKGAEAVVSFSEFIGKKIAVKDRIPKSYRAKELDIRLRKTRTRIEARLLHKAKKGGVLCPTVLYVGPSSLYLTFIDGTRPEVHTENAKGAGMLLAKLHEADIIHGDFTFANLIFSRSLHVIDFGLGFFSDDVEDKAVDVLTMLNSLSEKSFRDAFLQGYANYGSYDAVMKRMDVVKSRVRYF